jgi:hypothetical protein
VDTAYQLIFTSFFFYSKSFQITTMLCLNQWKEVNYIKS